MSPTIRSRLVAGLQQRVRAAVHADQHRPVLADVGPQRRQVLAVVVAAHDDQDVPAVEIGAHVGHADAVEQQLALACAGTPWCSSANASSCADSPARASVHRGSSTVSASCTHARWPPTSSPRDAARRRRRGPGRPPGPRVHHLAADVVDQRDAGGDEDLRPEVGVAPADRLPTALTTAAGRQRDQRLGARPGRCPRGR